MSVAPGKAVRHPAGRRRGSRGPAHGETAAAGEAATAPWRLLGTDPHGEPAGSPPAADGPTNMALDELMLRGVLAGGRPTIRLYRWDPPCLSLGRNQPARGRLDPRVLEGIGAGVVRRPTGGRAVLHRNEVTYSVAVPVGLLGSPRQTYRALNEGIGAGLRALGARVLGAGPARDRDARRGIPSGDPRCFGEAAPGELAASGRKVVGSAQRRVGRAILQHGSILLDGDQTAVDLAFGGPESAAPGEHLAGVARSRAAVGLSELLSRAPEPREVAEAVRLGMREALGISLAPATLDAAESALLEDLVARYRSAAWTWRR